MKRITLFLAGIFMIALVASGCESMGSDSKAGAIGGGLLGATAGGIIGNQSGHGWEGALIGGAAGVLTGGLIGNEFDKRQLELNAQHIPFTKIAEMGSQGVPGDVIISEIERTKSKYSLTSEIINYLKQDKVDDKVIDYMLKTAPKK